MLSYNATPFCPSSSYSRSSASTSSSSSSDLNELSPPSPTGSNSSLPSTTSSDSTSITNPPKANKKPLIKFLQVRTHRRVSSMDSSASTSPTSSSFAIGVQDLPSRVVEREDEDEGMDGYWSEICREVGI